LSDVLAGLEASDTVNFDDFDELLVEGEGCSY
jgi:hypothetical protein